jgi:O-acetyl-ADP-ribose deacetylase (regulator of RNase III)
VAENIGIPAISVGIFGFPIDTLTKIMFEGALQFINDNKSIFLEEISFINNDINTHENFCKEFERRFENINPLNQ